MERFVKKGVSMFNRPTRGATKKQSSDSSSDQDEPLYQYGELVWKEMTYEGNKEARLAVLQEWWNSTNAEDEAKGDITVCDASDVSFTRLPHLTPLVIQGELATPRIEFPAADESKPFWCFFMVDVSAQVIYVVGCCKALQRKMRLVDLQKTRCFNLPAQRVIICPFACTMASESEPDGRSLMSMSGTSIGGDNSQVSSSGFMPLTDLDRLGDIDVGDDQFPSEGDSDSASTDSLAMDVGSFVLPLWSTGFIHEIMGQDINDPKGWCRVPVTEIDYDKLPTLKEAQGGAHYPLMYEIPRRVVPGQYRRVEKIRLFIQERLDWMLIAAGMMATRNFNWEMCLPPRWDNPSEEAAASMLARVAGLCLLSSCDAKDGVARAFYETLDRVESGLLTWRLDRLAANKQLFHKVLSRNGLMVDSYVENDPPVGKKWYWVEATETFGCTLQIKDAPADVLSYAINGKVFIESNRFSSVVLHWQRQETERVALGIQSKQDHTRDLLTEEVLSRVPSFKRGIYPLLRRHSSKRSGAAASSTIFPDIEDMPLCIRNTLRAYSEKKGRKMPGNAVQFPLARILARAGHTQEGFEHLVAQVARATPEGVRQNYDSGYIFDREELYGAPTCKQLVEAADNAEAVPFACPFSKTSDPCGSCKREMQRAHPDVYLPHWVSAPHHFVKSAWLAKSRERQASKRAKQAAE